MKSPDMQKRFLDTTALETLRQTTDWNALCCVLGLERDEKRSKGNDWWMRSPFSEDKTPSFHIKPADGIWYCFSTRQGGGVIELVQKLEGLNCFQAGEWLIDTGCAPEPDGVQISGERKKKSAAEHPAMANFPITQSLLPNLSEQGTHEEFKRRGISDKTCHYLGCGLLAKGRSRLKDRIVFQMRGLEQTDDGLKPVILTHIGRATTPEQMDAGGKWLTYKGFRKSAELFNLDKLLLDPAAREQVLQTGRILIVEGPFDVAKLIEAEVFNVVALMGSDLSDEARPKLELIAQDLHAPDFQFWLDRDKAGMAGQSMAMEKVMGWGMQARAFDWSARFGMDKITIPENIQDPCDMSATQIKWLRNRGLI